MSFNPHFVYNIGLAKKFFWVFPQDVLEKPMLLLLLLSRFSHVQLHSVMSNSMCNPIDSSPPGSPIPEILQERTLEWVAISFSSVWKWKVKVKVKSLNRVWLLETPWTAAHQAPLSMGFSRQEYCSGVEKPMRQRKFLANPILLKLKKIK